MKKRKRNEGERTNNVQHAYRSKHNNFINQLIQLPLNALSTIYIKTLTCTSSDRIPTSNRNTNKLNQSSYMKMTY